MRERAPARSDPVRTSIDCGITAPVAAVAAAVHHRDRGRVRGRGRFGGPNASAGAVGPRHHIGVDEAVCELALDGDRFTFGHQTSAFAARSRVHQRSGRYRLGL